ncbi:MAG: TonB-dependent receptor [Bacteroidales bacterium]|nr:TonB-dependent receptor [Bacteroidales bacterium]
MRFHASLILSLCAISSTLCAQHSLFTDTIRINEIVVNGNYSGNISNGYRRFEVDSVILSERKDSDLSEVLSETIPVYIKNYSPGGLSSLSLRGTTAVHSNILWNGLSLSSPMLGQSDFSLIPAGFIDELSIEYGNASIIKGNGTFGALITINTKPDWKNRYDISLKGKSGSYGLWSGELKASAGTSNFKSVTRAFLETADNNFKYINDVSYVEPVVEHRHNSEISLKAIMQELYFKGQNSNTSIALWLQSSNRNLPSNILVTSETTGEKQNDESLRLAINHTRSNKKSILDFSSGILYDRLDYINEKAYIKSDNRSSVFIMKVSDELPLKGASRLKISVTEEFSIVNSINYDGEKTRNVLTVSGIVRKKIFKNTGATLIIKEILPDSELLIPDFSAALDYTFYGKQKKWLKVNFARNSRLPTLNDMYWNPGGNPDIDNEYCYSGELNLGIDIDIAPANKIESELSLHTSRIRNMIQWLPGEYNYWSPVNIQSVNINGVDADFTLKGNAGRLRYDFIEKLAFNASIYKSGSPEISGRQLIYVPRLQATGTAKIQYSLYYVTISSNITGRRFTTTDNSSYLDRYCLINAEAGMNILKGINRLNLKFRIENFMNTRYQLIEFYPMPGRTYLFSIEYRITK